MADPEPGFSRSFPDIGEFLAFAWAEIKRRVPSCSSRKEELRAREACLAADEDMLDARELRVALLEETLQWRLRELEDQERSYLEAAE